MRRPPMIALLLLLLAAFVAPPAEAAAKLHRSHQRVAVARGHAPRARRAAAPVAVGTWGSTVYGASLPSLDGSCTDPFDPDPIGGPDGVGAGGPGAFLGRCNGPGRVQGR